MGVFAALAFLATPVAAENLRIGFWNVELNRQGPGLLVRDLTRGDDPQIAAVITVLGALDADILVLSGFDFDLRLIALSELADQLGKTGDPYHYRFALPPNSGVATGLDLDGDGRTGGPRDAQGYGRFPGEGGMAILSRLPIDTTGVQSFSSFLWRDLPGAMLPPEMPADVGSVQRLSSNAHWDVPVRLHDGQILHLLAWHATPPVFDGPEDRNGRRNHDEAAFWFGLIDGALPFPPPVAPFVLIGQPNLDPVKGDGLPDAVRALLNHPALQDPDPQGAMGNATADFTARNGPGHLRSDMILPSRDLVVSASGVMWPAADDPDLATLQVASRHRPVWVDLSLP